MWICRSRAAILSEHFSQEAISARSGCRIKACRFNLSAPRVEHWLGVAVRRLRAIEDKVQRRLKCDVSIVVRRHVAIVAVAVILAVDDLRHALKRLDYLILRDDAVLEPVGDMLARYPKRRSIFH